MELNSITLYLTERCNLDCYYCFAPKSNRDIRLDTAIASVEFLLKRSGGLSDIGLVFFGGEPLVRFDLIREIVRYAKVRATMKGKNFKFSVTTNGTLITEEMADFFKDNRFKIIINYDGDESRVIKAKGEWAYGSIINSVRLLNERGIDVDARVTIEPSDMRLVDFAKSTSNAGFKTIFLVPIFFSDIDAKRTDEEMIRLADFIIECILEREPLRIRVISDAILTILGLEEMPSRFCEAGYSGVTIDVEGKIMPCARFNAWRKDFMLGDVFEGRMDQKKVGLLAEVSSLTIKGCEKCPAKTTCCRACIASNYEANKDLNMPDRTSCVWKMAVHKAAEHILDELYVRKKEPAFIEWILRLNNPWKIMKGVKRISLTDIEMEEVTESTTNIYFNLEECDLDPSTGKRILNFLERIKKGRIRAIIRRPLPPCIFDEVSMEAMRKYGLPPPVLDLSSKSERFNKSFLEIFEAWKPYAKLPRKCRDCELRLKDECHYAYFGFN